MSPGEKEEMVIKTHGEPGVGQWGCGQCQDCQKEKDSVIRGAGMAEQREQGICRTGDSQQHAILQPVCSQLLPSVVPP